MSSIVTDLSTINIRSMLSVRFISLFTQVAFGGQRHRHPLIFNRVLFHYHLPLSKTEAWRPPRHPSITHVLIFSSSTSTCFPVPALPPLQSSNHCLHHLRVQYHSSDRLSVTSISPDYSLKITQLALDHSK